jgi:hypothetical protein
MNKAMDDFGVFDYIETPQGTYEYTAEEIRKYFAGITSDGIMKGCGAEFAPSVSGLTVTLGAGEAWLLGVHGTMVGSSAFTQDPVSSGMLKICSLVLDVDITNQLMGITVLVGTQAASPSAPILTQTATRYQQLICKATVHDNGTVTIEDARTIVSKPGDGVTPEGIGAAKRSYTANYTLLASAWSSKRYTITTAMLSIIAHVLSADTPVHVGFSTSNTLAQRQALQLANLHPYAQSAGSITIEADGTAPTIDCPVSIVVEGGVY